MYRPAFFKVVFSIIIIIIIFELVLLDRLLWKDGHCTGSLMMWKGEQKFLTALISTKAKKCKNSNNFEELQDRIERRKENKEMKTTILTK